MDGETVFVAAVVKRTSKNRFYLHEVVDSRGNIIKIGNRESANPTSLAADGDAGTQSPLPTESITQTPPVVKPQSAPDTAAGLGFQQGLDADAGRIAQMKATLQGGVEAAAPEPSSPLETRLRQERGMDPASEAMTGFQDEIALELDSPSDSDPDKEPVSFLETTLDVNDALVKGVIPKGVEIRSLRTIAGSLSGTVLRVAAELSKKYGGQPLQWIKMGGIIRTDNFRYDVHWVELDGKHYEEKIKEVKEAKKK